MSSGADSRILPEIIPWPYVSVKPLSRFIQREKAKADF
jgi:hypothetical protein